MSRYQVNCSFMFRSPKMLCVLSWVFMHISKFAFSKGPVEYAFTEAYQERFAATQRLFGKGNTDSLGPLNSGIPLDVDKVVDYFHTSKKKVFILDHDGTLHEFNEEKRPANAGQLLHQGLEKLNTEENLSLALVSGRDVKFMEDNFGKYENFFLSGEIGAFIRPQSEKASKKEWESFIEPPKSDEWKKTVKGIMDDAENKHKDIFGPTIVQLKEQGVGFHYYNVPEMYTGKAAELAQQLTSRLTGLTAKERGDVDLVVQHDDNTIEVRPQAYSKSYVAEHIWKSVPDANLVVCIGDWKSDEEMFQRLHEMEMEMNPENCIVLTVHVDNGYHKQTCAKFRLPDIGSVVRMIRSCAKISPEIV